MAKDIIIEHDGQEIQHSGVKNLKIPTGKGSMLWYPEDEVVTGGLTVYSNGEYEAENNGLYAFSHVIVNITQSSSITGRDPVSGLDYTYTVDETTGEIVKETAPSGIEIVVNPTKTEYTDGETIDYSGIQVRAVDAHGDVWQNASYPDGIIPFSELIFPISKAESGTQTIPVQWMRPGDYLRLEASFDIQVSGT